MIDYQKHTLDNGLTVIVHQDSSTPIVAMNIVYKVGSKNESADKTGFAHLFEHLMFGGSVNIPKYDEPLQGAGGDNNAFTNADFTDYYLTLPKNNLETAFWLESDRMYSLAFNQNSLDVQRQVVIEEFKQNYLNQPYGDVYLLLKPLAYKSHPYQWNTIGKDITHIEQATMGEVRSFYDNYYNPNNAILSVVGDVDTDEVLGLADKWFASISSPDPHLNGYPAEPEQLEMRRQVVHRDVPQDALYMAWHMPGRMDQKFYHCDLISDLLSNGNSSRLYQSLVKKQQLFTDINAFVSGDQDPGLFIVSGKVTNGVAMEIAEEAVVNDLNKLINNDLEEGELKKVKNKIESTLIFSQISVLNKAMNLGYYELLGDVANFNTEVDRYMAVTTEDIRQTASSLFKPANTNVLHYLKK